MINFEAFFKISYGLYIVSTGDKKAGNAFISNTVFQVTAEPPQFATCCNKNNFSCNLLDKTGAFSVSVLKEESSNDIIGRLGYKSGNDTDKLNGLNIHYGETGVPVILNDAVATFEFKIVNKIDVGTHIMFIGEMVNAELIDSNSNPMTYAYYRSVRNGFSPKNAPTYIDKSKIEIREEKPSVKNKCTVCGYIYDNADHSIPFDDLPDNWKCPVCGVEKEDFKLI